MYCVTSWYLWSFTLAPWVFFLTYGNAYDSWTMCLSVLNRSNMYRILVRYLLVPRRWLKAACDPDVRMLCQTASCGRRKLIIFPHVVVISLTALEGTFNDFCDWISIGWVTQFHIVTHCRLTSIHCWCRLRRQQFQSSCLHHLLA